jgi:16S rRNA (adenine1518-N6/adenine1519-N6)-dimethyltransferase
VARPLGQHFLFNPAILERIAAACGDAPDLVVEIGPGPGSLTRALLSRASRVVAVEVDPVLAAALPSRVPDSRLQVVEADALSVDLTQWGPAVVAGNLPYYIASPLIERVVRMGPSLLSAVFLIQKEVADRLVASAGTRDYGYLTVATQLRCRVERLFEVKPGAFRPPPKVHSTVVRLTPYDSLPVEDGDRFLRFVGVCFRHKRKTLRNNLAGSWPRDLIEAQPEASLRAEQLSLPAWVELYRRLQQY